MRKPEPDFSAKERFPEIFMLPPAEQKESFDRIHRIIEKFYGFSQFKHSHKGQPKAHQISHSLFFLKSGENFRYFLSPHKNDKPEKKDNLLGKGKQAAVIPGYELHQQNGQWCLAPEAYPSIALKIFVCPNNHEPWLKRIKSQMQIMRDFYPTEYPFTEPYVRITQTKNPTLFASHGPKKIYLPMPYFPGKAGDTFWEDKNPGYLEDFLEALSCCISSIEELSRLHELDLLHCDIKPANFMLHEGRSKLIDFGFSRLNSDLPPEGDSRTQAYAPWSLLKPNYLWSFEDERYALGLTLYELLSGIDLLSDLTTSEFTKNFKAGAPRIDPHFLKVVPIEEGMKHRLIGPIHALMDNDPSKRPLLSEVQMVFSQILAEIQTRKQTQHPLNMWKTPEPEEPESPRSVSTPTPSPSPYDK